MARGGCDTGGRLGCGITTVEETETAAGADREEIGEGRSVGEGDRTRGGVRARQFAGGVHRRVGHRLRGFGK